VATSTGRQLHRISRLLARRSRTSCSLITRPHHRWFAAARIRGATARPPAAISLLVAATTVAAASSPAADAPPSGMPRTDPAACGPVRRRRATS
jgi:hypothetical protein